MSRSLKTQIYAISIRLFEAKRIDQLSQTHFPSKLSCSDFSTGCIVSSSTDCISRSFVVYSTSVARKGAIFSFEPPGKVIMSFLAPKGASALSDLARAVIKVYEAADKRTATFASIFSFRGYTNHTRR